MPSLPLSPHVSASWVRGLLHARRLRGHYLGANNFSDPAWDILLQIFAKHLDHELATLSVLCASADLPESTALRWLRKLEQDGLIERREPGSSGTMVGLTSQGSVAMQRYFAAISSQAEPI